MAVIDTLRPNATPSNTGPWLAKPSGTTHGVTSDSTDTTWAEGQGYPGGYALTLGYPSHTPPANHQRHALRHRFRWHLNALQMNSSLQGFVYAGMLGPITNITTAWAVAPAALTAALATPGAASMGTTSWYTNLELAGNTVIYEVWLDIDCRHKPTFDADVKKLNGASAAGGVVDDTYRPRFTFSIPEYDGLGARSWLFAVKKDGVVIHTEGGDGPPPAQTAPFLILDNGSYVADFQVFSTIRNDEAFSSDVVSIPFTVNYTPGESLIQGVRPDCRLGGYVISVLIQGEEIEDMSVVRHDYTTGGLTPVRGLVGIPVNTALEIVDFEAPLEHEVGYWLYAGEGIPIAPPPIQEEIFPTQWFRDACDIEQMYLRWLFQPGVMTSAFCLGPIGEIGYSPRSGVFPVIGRSDPVVVNDEQETSRGTLRLIGQTTDEVQQLRTLLTKNAQPTLLTIPEHYMLGKSGQLYFQPLAVKEQWINPDNRIPQHALTIDYVEISPPALTSALTKTGNLFGHGGWIIWATDPPDGTVHGDPTDLYSDFHILLASQKTFQEALYDEPEP